MSWSFYSIDSCVRIFDPGTEREVRNGGIGDVIPFPCLLLFIFIGHIFRLREVRQKKKFLYSFI